IEAIEVRRKSRPRPQPKLKARFRFKELGRHQALGEGNQAFRPSVNARRAGFGKVRKRECRGDRLTGGFAGKKGFEKPVQQTAFSARIIEYRQTPFAEAQTFKQ